VPTNAQLAITLLRIGEHNKAPIPPPPGSSTPPPMEAHATAGENLEHLGMHAPPMPAFVMASNSKIDATEEEVSAAVNLDHEAIASGQEDQEKARQKKPNKFVALLKSATKGGVNTALSIDHAKAIAGARHARERLGAIRSTPKPPTGPVRFPARYKGTKGHAYITATATTPALSWKSKIEDGDPAWTVSIKDIAELKKVGGLGWKSKIVTSWATEKQIADGLAVKSKSGDEWHLTSILDRDELFNRLVAMGSQMWEAW
jgi:hypothetical protein